MQATVSPSHFAHLRQFIAHFFLAYSSQKARPQFWRFPPPMEVTNNFRNPTQEPSAARFQLLRDALPYFYKLYSSFFRFRIVLCFISRWRLENGSYAKSRSWRQEVWMVNGIHSSAEELETVSWYMWSERVIECSEINKLIVLPTYSRWIRRTWWLGSGNCDGRRWEHAENQQSSNSP